MALISLGNLWDVLCKSTFCCLIEPKLRLLAIILSITAPLLKEMTEMLYFDGLAFSFMLQMCVWQEEINKRLTLSVLRMSQNAFPWGESCLLECLKSVNPFSMDIYHFLVAVHLQTAAIYQSRQSGWRRVWLQGSRTAKGRKWKQTCYWELCEALVFTGHLLTDHL